MKRKSEVSVTNVVAVDPATAFAIFTDEIDQWWRRGRRLRFAAGADGGVRFEDRSRLVEFDAEGVRHEVGRVLAWEPAARLAFQWRPRGLSADAGEVSEVSEVTEVEVRFEAVDGGTRVTLEHRGIDAFRADDPARYGLEGEAFHSMIALYWGDQINRLRFHCTKRQSR